MEEAPPHAYLPLEIPAKAPATQSPHLHLPTARHRDIPPHSICSAQSPPGLPAVTSALARAASVHLRFAEQGSPGQRLADAPRRGLSPRAWLEEAGGEGLLRGFVESEAPAPVQAHHVLRGNGEFHVRPDACAERWPSESAAPHKRVTARSSRPLFPPPATTCLVLQQDDASRSYCLGCGQRAGLVFPLRSRPLAVFCHPTSSLPQPRLFPAL